MDRSGIDFVKVFSATKGRDRDELGERITRWILAHPGVTILDAIVRLSSDSKFHCLSIVLLGTQQHPVKP